MAFNWSEILFYLLPIVSLLFVGTYGKPYLYFNKRIKFAPIDVVFPILLVCLHFISRDLLFFSIIPHLFVLISLLAIGILVWRFTKNEDVVVGKFYRMLVNISFSITFILYLLVTILRIIQVITM
ncbi:DUF3397 family protein [Aerococcaceae bacterium 50-4]